jgi:VCBS repeat protein/FG-GAP repeat protein
VAYLTRAQMKNTSPITMIWSAAGTLLALLMMASPALALSPPRDAIDLSQAAVYNSPADIASWPVTTAITRLDMARANNFGLSFTFGAHNTWPDYTPPGWTGPIQYTVWAVVNVNGRWYTSGFIQMWRTRASTGAPILTDFARNWAYDARWGPMKGHQPVVGEQMGFFVSAGNARGTSTATSVRQRSNVVLVSLPANDNGSFTYPEFAPTLTRKAGGVSTDFDGDGRADLAVYRPSTGTGFILQSATGAGVGIGGGQSTDVPVPGDYDGDGTADLAIFRPAIGAWLIRYSSTGGDTSVQWGNALDIPVPGDYDGDGKTDVAVFRPGTGTWFIINSSTGAATGVQWGNSADVTVPGDYDGDGKTDVAVFRPSTGTWFIVNSSTGAATGVQWGNGADWPVPGDYDGDGKTDIAVFRPSTGTWFVVNSSTGTSMGVQWGNSADIPILKRP